MNGHYAYNLLVKYLHLFAFALLVVSLAAACAWRAWQDVSARRHARMLYIEDGSDWNLLVNGDGRLTVQKREVSTTGLWPTCATRVDESEVNRLFQLMMDKHSRAYCRKALRTMLVPLKPFLGSYTSFGFKLDLFSANGSSKPEK